MLDGLGSAFATASAIQQQQVNLQVQTSVLKKSLEVQKQTGELIIGMLQAAIQQPAGKAVGLGANLDVYA